MAFGRYPFILKRAVVEIVQYYELFLKYDLINATTGISLNDELHWESMVESYLEKSHSYIDKQRKVFSDVSRFLTTDLSRERDKIILPVTIEHRIITKLRNTYHHKSVFATRFWSRSGTGNRNDPIPGLIFFNCDLDQEEQKYVDEMNFQTDSVSLLFQSHCYQFITKSHAVRDLLLEHLT